MMNKQEKQKEVSKLAKQIKSLRTNLWVFVKNEEFENAQLVKNNISKLQKQLLDTLIGSRNN